MQQGPPHGPPPGAVQNQLPFQPRGQYHQHHHPQQQQQQPQHIHQHGVAPHNPQMQGQPQKVLVYYQHSGAPGVSEVAGGAGAGQPPGAQQQVFVPQTSNYVVLILNKTLHFQSQKSQNGKALCFSKLKNLFLLIIRPYMCYCLSTLIKNLVVSVWT